MTQLPGNPQRQAILQAIIRLYEDDPRVCALILFGSLVTNKWDGYADLDLDVVVADLVPNV